MNALVNSVFQPTYFSMGTPAVPTAERYIQSRFRDYMTLTYEIAGAPKHGGVVDLGYCKLIDQCRVEASGGVFEFRGLVEASAFILRRFW